MRPSKMGTARRRRSRGRGGPSKAAQDPQRPSRRTSKSAKSRTTQRFRRAPRCRPSPDVAYADIPLPFGQMHTENVASTDLIRAAVVGWALNEEYIYNSQGHMENPGFLDYRIPVASDLPMIETVMVEVPNPGHPYGAKGAAEVNIARRWQLSLTRSARDRPAAHRAADVAAESARPIDARAKN